MAICGTVLLYFLATLFISSFSINAGLLRAKGEYAYTTMLFCWQ
jgi:hypothetical protein